MRLPGRAALLPQDGLIIGPFAAQSIMEDIQAIDTGFASGVPGTTTTMRYYPFIVHRTTVVTGWFWGNGAAVAGETGIGIYAEDGTRLVYTKEANVGAAALQLSVVNLPYTLTKRTRYFLGIGADSATQAYSRANLGGDYYSYLGMKRTATGITPSTAGFDETAPSAHLPLCGLICTVGGVV